MAGFGAPPAIFEAEPDAHLRELEAQLEPEVQLEESFNNVVVIDNVPKVPSSKLEKLRKVLLKICHVCGSVVGEGQGIFLPTDESGTTAGYVSESGEVSRGALCFSGFWLVQCGLVASSCG